MVDSNSKMTKLGPALAVLLSALYSSGHSAAQAASPAATVNPVASASPAPQASRVDWDERYAHARRLFVSDHEAEAAPEFEQLSVTAPTLEDARRAGELAELCRAKLTIKADSSHLRGTGELTLLYSTAYVYGLGTSAWVAMMTQPKNLAGALLPFAVLTTAAVGGVSLADNYRPFRRGVPQSIASGAYLGFGEGIWLVGIQHSGATRRDDGSAWDGKRVASALWGAAACNAWSWWPWPGRARC